MINFLFFIQNKVYCKNENEFLDIQIWRILFILSEN